MRNTLFFSILISLVACGPRSQYITTAQVNDTAFVAGTFDTLAAYRKAPGQTKSVYVPGYYKKDSTYVKPHYRSPKQ